MIFASELPKSAITSMAYIVEFDAYELHMGDENVFNDFY